MNKTSILIVEDEKNISNFISTILMNNAYKIIECRNGKEALSFLSSRTPNLILLDLGLPDMDGMDVLQTIRKTSNVPIIIISARPQESDKVRALDLGADDYITKPFSTPELLARIRTALRHSAKQVPDHIFRINKLRINFDERSVTLDQEKLHLTNLEFDLLALLAHHAGKLLTYEYIVTSLWDTNDEKNNQLLRFNMARLRKKIEKNPGNPQYIFTEVGIGYRLADENTPLKEINE